MNIGKTLATEANKKGICKEREDNLSTLQNNKRAMLNMYVKGLDFCLSNDFPDNSYIRDNFKGVMEDYGVFLDDNTRITNYDRCVALGKTLARVEASKYHVTEVYVKHNSVVNLYAKDNAFVRVDIFDNATVNIHANDEAKVQVNRYGGKVQIIDQGSSAKIRIRQKKTKTYQTV